MFLPDWIVDDVLAPADPSAIRVVLALFRHGSLQVAADGGQRVYWRGGRVQLGRISHQSKRSVDAALTALAAAGFVALHQPGEATHGIAISAPLDRAGEPRATVSSPSLAARATAAWRLADYRGGRGASVAAPSESPTAHMHDGGDPDPSQSPFVDHGDTTSTTMTRDELLSRLTEEGVTNPASWLVKFKHAHIEAALDRLDDAYEREESAAGAVRHYGDAVDVRHSITNPPGFLYGLLRAEADLPPRAPWPRTRRGKDGIARYG